ncbi:hypothetical protein Hanom_Chr03g00249721 [Helianthus anomalus]
MFSLIFVLKSARHFEAFRFLNPKQRASHISFMYNMISFSFNQKLHLSHLFYILVFLSSKPFTYIHITNFRITSWHRCAV